MKIFKHSILFLLLITVFTCKKDGDSCVNLSSMDLFGELWFTFKHNYPSFDIVEVDWDSIYHAHRSTVTETTNEEELFNIFSQMLLALKDGHSDLTNNDSVNTRVISFFQDKVVDYPRNHIGWTNMKEKYLEEVEDLGRVSFAKIKNENIGYIGIASFSEAEEKYMEIDAFLERYPDLDGLIVDVRQNQGGSETKASIIASRFTEEIKTYRYTKIKEGCGEDDLSDFFTLDLEPDGANKFLGEIILLTNVRSFSAAEDFTLMMKALPNVTHIGAATFGGFATGPDKYTLNNGWGFRVSRKITYDLSKTPIIGGIQPEIAIDISPEDEMENIDAILEKAVELLE